jgi:hypothetical protein
MVICGVVVIFRLGDVCLARNAALPRQPSAIQVYNQARVRRPLRYEHIQATAASGGENRF